MLTSDEACRNPKLLLDEPLVHWQGSGYDHDAILISIHDIRKVKLQDESMYK